MRLPFRLGRREYVMEPVGREHAETLATLHQEGFARPWSAEEFEGLLVQEAVSGYLAREIGRKGGQSVSKNREHMARIGRKGGAASRGHH
jgi:hypothetical protein